MERQNEGSKRKDLKIRKEIKEEWRSLKTEPVSAHMLSSSLPFLVTK